MSTILSYRVQLCSVLLSLEPLPICRLREFEIKAILIRLIFGALVSRFSSVEQENSHIQLMKVLSIWCCRCMPMLLCVFCFILFDWMEIIILAFYGRSSKIHHRRHQKKSFHLNSAPLLMLAYKRIPMIDQRQNRWEKWNKHWYHIITVYSNYSFALFLLRVALHSTTPPKVQIM